MCPSHLSQTHRNPSDITSTQIKATRTTNHIQHNMDSNATESMSMDMGFTNAVDASIMATMHMLQSCTLGESSNDALKSEQAKDVDMDVDTPTIETSRADEMIVDSPQHEHTKHEVCPSPPSPILKHPILTTPKHQPASSLSRKPACKSAHAPKPQHKHLKHLAGVDAKCKSPAALSLNRVMAASVQRSRTHSLLRDPRAPQKQSRFAQAVLDAIEEEA